MKRLFPMFIFLSSCASSDTTSSKSIPSLQLNRIAELNRQIQLVGEFIWPGFAHFPRKMVFVDFNNQWALNVEPLPSYYKEIKVPGELAQFVTNAAWTETFRDEFGSKHEKPREFLANSYFPESIKHHFKDSVFFLNSLEVFHSYGDKWTADDWVNISVHELFHNFQDSKFSYSEEILKAAFDNTFQKQNEDSDLRAMIINELDILAGAVCETDGNSKVNKLKQALHIRKKRWELARKKLGADPVPGERFAVAIEGTARYAEEIAMKLVRIYQSDTLIKKDPFYEGFKVYEKRLDKKFWCKQIQDFPKRRGEKFWYPMGFSYSLLLDDLVPGWKEDLFLSPQFFDKIFEQQKYLVK